MQNYKYEQERELSAYPKEYTLDMALANDNIVEYGVVPYNSKRMQLFMYNYTNKIPDKVVIVDYGIDGYPTIRILQNFGDIIIYTQRYFINETPNYYTFYGKHMIEKYRKNGNKLIRDYNLVTFDNKEITTFNELLF
jgi:hypothetical protein